ncbi:flagellar filament outer layer protein FlaA [Spirochaeta africana]|uniref:Flagellar filament outer layer protein Flaa n=1 Tax=Spirochaeta africana (strain ATCC 700263 / DSM 8902 / Z-7692) TaxID=889378 RepID=H9UHB9_SPIAZ|nr:flagellar filament outer layer protein FlaA [Spirochaeta africana]AFG36912.1 Flagellar filament outer layer protein Flaa [Spirochaeta africana DSM 8902]
MKRLSIQLLFLLVSAAVFAQVQAGEITPEALGSDTAQQRLQEVLISSFEDPGMWRVSMPLDQGIISHRRFPGGPADKRPLEGAEEAGIEAQDEYVLGVKAEFFRRGNTTLSILANRPLVVPGIAKTISVWVVGRNFNHELSVVIQDHFGNRAVLPMGRLNFTGWRELSVAVPTHITQRSIHYNDLMGIQILGFVVRPALEETYGSYYIYFDDLRVVTDLFAEESRDPDDMVDSW